MAGDVTICTGDYAGSHLTKADSTGATSYAYDANDRLEAEIGTQDTITCFPDANGSLIKTVDCT